MSEAAVRRRACSGDEDNADEDGDEDDGGDQDNDDGDLALDDVATPQQRRSSKKARNARRKTSVVHYMFEASPNPTEFVCRLHTLMEPGVKHPRLVKQGARGTSNLLNHARQYHGLVLEGLIKAHNEGRSVKFEFESAMALMLPPSAGPWNASLLCRSPATCF